MEKLVVGVQNVVDAGVQIAVGDIVLLLGSQDAALGQATVQPGADPDVLADARVEMSPADAAGAIGTIDYEVLTGLLPQSPRWPLADAKCAVDFYDWPEGFGHFNEQFA